MGSCLLPAAAAGVWGPAQLFNPVVTEELRHVIVAVDNAGQFSNDFLEFSQTADLRAMNINPQRAVVIQGAAADVCCSVHSGPCVPSLTMLTVAAAGAGHREARTGVEDHDLPNELVEEQPIEPAGSGDVACTLAAIAPQRFLPRLFAAGVLLQLQAQRWRAHVRKPADGVLLLPVGCCELLSAVPGMHHLRQQRCQRASGVRTVGPHH